MPCLGNKDDHCCYFGEVCKHLEENTVAGRRWACGLRRKHGEWDDVYQSKEWPDVLKNAIAVGLPDYYKCGDWPYPNEKCGVCGING